MAEGEQGQQVETTADVEQGPVAPEYAVPGSELARHQELRDAVVARNPLMAEPAFAQATLETAQQIADSLAGDDPGLYERLRADPRVWELAHRANLVETQAQQAPAVEMDQFDRALGAHRNPLPFGR